MCFIISCFIFSGLDRRLCQTLSLSPCRLLASSGPLETLQVVLPCFQELFQPLSLGPCGLFLLSFNFLLPVKYPGGLMSTAREHSNHLSTVLVVIASFEQ